MPWLATDTFCRALHDRSNAKKGNRDAASGRLRCTASHFDLSPSGKSLLRRPSSEGSPCCFRTQGT